MYSLRNSHGLIMLTLQIPTHFLREALLTSLTTSNLRPQPAINFHALVTSVIL